MFGTTGSENDIDIMNSSTLCNDVRTGKWPPCRPDTTIAGYPLTWFYYVTDGVYLRYRVFMSSISSPRTVKEKLYSKHQEGCKKRSRASFWRNISAVPNFISPVAALAKRRYGKCRGSMRYNA
jgi:hypothetical protein